ncbi:hypothetical protein CHS0354_040482 [Potamilus streckersoni]|uniref:Beta-lactamase-related domain-containing protein n=1 Tax=Potamilus streckersoni TaxID=2493646 RepID=A0AAE0TJU0_9BIVA|nr:hypothetical protein CHS0354_040482 [Potamilus streckersoni]
MGLINQALLILVIALAINLIPLLWKQSPPLNVDGYFHPDFKKVADLFREWFQVKGEDDGVAFALYHKGELVLDMWGGYADLESERPWHKDTISEAFSATKGLAAIVVAMMVEKGLLDYKKPVSHYWPEFAQNGKDNITVEMLVSHQGGLLLLDTPIHYRDLKDNVSRAEESLVNQKPVFPPGTAYGYHALTFGAYVDRLVAKADPKRRTIEQIFEDEIAKPFDIDFHMNTPKMESHRVARLRSQSLWTMIMIWILEPHRIWGFLRVVMNNSPYLKGAGSAIAGISKLEHHNNPDVREVTISSYSGTGTARGLAKLYGILANGGSTNGKQLLSRATIDKLSIPLVAGEEVLFKHKSIIFGPGTMLKNNSKAQYMFGHPGYGGQEGYGDLNTGLGIGFITNCINHEMAEHPLYIALKKAVFDTLDKKYN